MKYLNILKSYITKAVNHAEYIVLIGLFCSNYAFASGGTVHEKSCSSRAYFNLPLKNLKINFDTQANSKAKLLLVEKCKPPFEIKGPYNKMKRSDHYELKYLIDNILVDKYEFDLDQHMRIECIRSPHKIICTNETQ